MTEVAPGQIRGRGLGRRFLIRLSHSRSLKEAILRRELPKTREIWALRDVDLDVEPDVLLLDEVLAVGDVAFQEKCYERIWEFKRGGGTIVFVSHDERAVARVCDRALLLEEGRQLETGPAAEVVRAYHARLAGDTAERAASRNGEPSGPCRVHEVRAVAGDGSIRERFTEGEPMALEVWLYAEQGLEEGRVS